MSEEIEEVVETAEVEGKVEKEVAEEVEAVEEKVEEKDEKPAYSPFVDANDTFDVTVKYYKESKKMFVYGVNDDFDDNHEPMAEIVSTFKYPDQGDVGLIASYFNNTETGDVSERMTIMQLTRVEFSRLVVLIRSWTMKDKIEASVISKLDPSIIAAIIYGIREEIEMKGIV